LRLPLPAPLPVEGNAKRGLIANLLNEVKNRRMPLQHNRSSLPQNVEISSFSRCLDRLIDDLQRSSACAAANCPTRRDQDQPGKFFFLFLQAPIPPPTASRMLQSRRSCLDTLPSRTTLRLALHRRMIICVVRFLHAPVFPNTTMDATCLFLGYAKCRSSRCAASPPD